MTESPLYIGTSVIVRATPEQAFTLFLRDFGRWWPRAYTWSGETQLQDIALGARVGELCTEFGPDGFRMDWGRMTALEPPRRLAFLWQIAPDRTPQPDPAKAAEVEVTFNPTGDDAEVRLVHSGFDRYGDGAAAYREGLASDQGWPFILRAFADKVAAGRPGDGR